MSSTAPPQRREVALSPVGLADLAGIGARRSLALTVRSSPALRSGLPLTLALALVAGGGRVVTPLTVQYAIDRGLTPSAVSRAALVGCLALVLAGCSSVVLGRRLQFRVERALAALRTDGLARIHDMAASTADRVPSADLVARLTSDLDQVTTFLQGGGVAFVTNTAQLLVATAVMIRYSWLLSLPVLVLAGGLLLIMMRIQRVIAGRFVRVRADVSRLQSVVAESVIGAPVIRSTGSEARTRAKLDEAVDRARDSQLRTLVPLHGNTSLGELAISTMTVSVILGGVWWALHGSASTPRMTPGDLLAMVFLVTVFVRPLQFLVQSLGEAQNALIGWRRALELVATPSAQVVNGEPVAAGPFGVELRGVSAAYAGPLVLRDITVQIRPGEHIAVVGRTGSGKSTFAKLITRRLSPVSGELLIAGVVVERIAHAALAGRLVIVPQDPFLFGGTVGDNIAVGAPRSTDEDVARVIESLGLSAWVATLPQGLDTTVALRGDRLSVGERQLVALARTALVDPDLLVLDEATSGIDPATDVAIQAALRTLARGRTTISIAHRMVTAATADRVLVFQDGRIVQSGHHDELRRQAGPYADLLHAWNERTVRDLLPLTER